MTEQVITREEEIIEVKEVKEPTVIQLGYAEKKVVYNNQEYGKPTCSLVSADGTVLKGCNKCDAFIDDYPEGCLHEESFKSKYDKVFKKYKQPDIPVIKVNKEKQSNSQLLVLATTFMWLITTGLLMFMIHSTNIENVQVNKELIALQTMAYEEVGYLKQELLTMNEQLEAITKRLAEIEARNEVLKESIANAKYDGNVNIHYFGQGKGIYWDRLNSTTDKVFGSMTDIEVTRDLDAVYVSTSFVREGEGKTAELKVLKDGTIHYKGVSQFEAEVVMQKLLNHIQGKGVN